MGKKDATGQQCQPIEQYRKQIGKQDWRKSRRDIRNLKHKGEHSELSPQYIVLMIAVVIGGLSFLYLFLVWCLGGASIDKYIGKSRPV